MFSKAVTISQSLQMNTVRVCFVMVNLCLGLSFGQAEETTNVEI